MRKAAAWGSCAALVWGLLLIGNFARSQSAKNQRFPSAPGAAAGAGVSTLIPYSPADYGKRKNASGQSGTGSQYSTGCVFRFAANGTMTGVRYWTPAGSSGTHNIYVYNYDAGGAALTTMSKSVTGGTIVVATFTTPIPVTAGVGYNLMVFTASYSQILYNYPVAGNATRSEIAIGPSLYLDICGYHNSVNSPGILDAVDRSGTYFGIEPVYTVP